MEEQELLEFGWAIKADKCLAEWKEVQTEHVSEVCFMPAHRHLRCEDELIVQALLMSSFFMVILCLRAAASVLLSECVILSQYICINVRFVPRDTKGPCLQWGAREARWRTLSPGVLNTEHLLLLNLVYPTRGCSANGSHSEIPFHWAIHPVTFQIVMPASQTVWTWHRIFFR